MTQDPDPFGVLRGHVASVNAVQFLTPTALLSGSGDGVVKLWDVSKRREISGNTAHSKAGVLQIARISPCHFVTQGRDGFVRLWDTTRFSDQANPISSYYCGSFSFTKCATMRSKSQAEAEFTQLVACPGSDFQEILVYDLRAGSTSPAIKMKIHGQARGMCMSLCIIQPSSRIANCTISKQYIVVGDEGGDIEIMDMRYGQYSLSKTEISTEKNPVLAMDIVSKASRIICGTSEQAIIGAELDWDAPKFKCTSEIFRCNYGGIASISVRPDERIFATTGWDRRTRIFHAQKLRPLAILKYHSDSVFDAAFSPDSKLLATGSKDKKIALWSIYQPD
uniref:Uncharacterized protein AlNc14C7G931 n=1 Tax=Albugo laibachii Nc14 TaxID=890382 RepID=F0W1G2_9STRA|nr:cleavage induced conserved hypothetical protein [Albugo laibachii Nc14]|eukprot:CCA14891.1 cleavage induced conserved hypothetical protein [Albugo laibachii Nc14]